MEIRDTRYARASDGAYIAYQSTGEGPVDLVWQFDHTGDVDLVWEDPVHGLWLRGLAGFSRLILHDRRGTGLSSRDVPPPNLETRVSDLRLVLDELGSDRPVLAGSLEGGAPNVMFAAVEPERVRSLVWFFPLPRVVWAPDFPWGIKSNYVELSERSLDLWGTNAYGAAWAAAEESEGNPQAEDEISVMGWLSRHTATPDVARELTRIWHETDVRGVLPSVRAPALLLTRSDPEELALAEYVASLMADATVQMLPGDLQTHDFGPWWDVVRRFMGVEPPPVGLDTVLSTVLFTDIVGSTERQTDLGDRAWKELIRSHHELVRATLERWHGVENDTAGDGFFATFDGPARAIRCALEITERVRDLGIEIRAGIHTGECEVIDGKHAGITVSIGARVLALAGPSRVLVSQTVKDLVAGSGLTFEDAGEHELKGLRERWRLYRAKSGEETS